MVTGVIHDKLSAYFGRDSIFYDVDTISMGTDFRKKINMAVGKCDVLLAVIGENWLEKRFDEGPSKGQRKLDDPNDWVRLEIETALTRDIPVVPVLIDNAKLPSKEDLPDALQELPFRNKADVRRDPDFSGDLERLTDGLQSLFDELNIETEPASRASAVPERIGRFSIKKVLGDGTFSRVYLAYDEQDDRPVAIRVPRPDWLLQLDDPEVFLEEARRVAQLDHPGIVPIFDIGKTDDGHPFIVSRFIAGTDLATKAVVALPSHRESAKLVSGVADALHHAHTREIYHRDLRPNLILLDTDGNPFVADFGLALRDDDFVMGVGLVGLPAYISPEQARGEGHRIDGRTDIFSLGVVFYELLTGRRPFHGELREELLKQVIGFDVRPPRQIDDTIDKELERICLKALAKRAADRYTTAKDLADDLKAFLGESQEVQAEANVFTPSTSDIAVGSTLRILPATAESDQSPTKIVPKGLRSFDAYDADFFLDLLPGARDREGLPDSLRFWKARIEESDPDKTFSVGLIYGPSGCGKSSLVKAGLLPRLSEKVIDVYVEATADDTEDRLLNGLRKYCPALSSGLNLPSTVAALRRGEGIAPDNQVLIVLDQFEQWLHAHKGEQNTELAQAVRQCDGRRVQCIVMVRDDFWMAVTQFMQELEVRVREDDNSAAVAKFDLRHAKNVLTAYGRAFSALAEAKDLTADQQQFLDQAVTGLARDDKVVCVRLALFAQMVEGKSWTPATLREVGGMEGVGVTFLKETFSASTAPPEHRLHQEAARAVLHALLPDQGTDIKGHMQSRKQLLEASGYEHRARDFADLLRILDDETRLLTPTDPEGLKTADQGHSSFETGEKYYQLTHDYLVPSLREWLTRKQQETRRGRAELRLAEHSQLWNSNRRNGYLPGPVSFVGIWWLTKRREWTVAQVEMMGRASRYYLLAWFSLVVLLLVACGIIKLEAISKQRAIDAVESKQRAIDAVDQLIGETDETKFSMQLHQLTSDEQSAAPPVLEERLNRTWPNLHDVFCERTNAAVALMALGRSEAVWPLFKHSPDTTRRSYLIDRYAASGGDPGVLLKQLSKESDASIRRALILTLGQFDKSRLPDSDKFITLLLKLHEQDLDSGIHGATDWVLRRWQREKENWLAEKDRKQWESAMERLATGKLEGDRQWYVTSENRHTMVVLPGGEYWYGELQERRKLDHGFAISTTEVTVEQFHQFLQGKEDVHNKDTSPHDDFPMKGVDWYLAAEYCNWLSGQEGIPKVQWCYEPNEKEEYAEGMTIPADYLKRTGYRLPTEEEWESACRAGSSTKFGFGDAKELLLNYARYSPTPGDLKSTSRVASLKPNDFGLFDMHGNISEWCQSSYERTESSDSPESEKVTSLMGRSFRGGSFFNVSIPCRSYFRDFWQPYYHINYMGFRVSRTYN